MFVQGRFRDAIACGAFAVALAAAPGRADPDVVSVSQAQDGRVVALSLQQTLELRLPAQFGTGSSWGLTALEGGVLRLADARIESDATQPGARENQLFVFHPLAAGVGMIALDYRRPWERDRLPERTFTLRATVTE